jgi:ParB/RepB/Spo0J family partition protein
MTTTAEAPAARSPANSTPKRYFAHIPTREISDFPFNYRMDFNTLAIAELSESIQKQGLIEPIIVLRQEGADRVGTVNGKVENWKHRYIGIAGERRWRAVQLAEMDEIPAIVYEGLTDQQALEIALVENLQRQDVNPIEEANGYRMLKERAHLKQNQIAERVGRPRSTVANTMRLLDLPPSVQEHISQGRLTKAHGIALLRFRGYDQVIEWMASKVLKEGMAAGELETGVPFAYELRTKGLLLMWDGWQLMHCGENVGEEELRKCRDEDKRVGWFRTANQGYVCLNVARKEEIEKRLDKAEKAYEKLLRKRQAQELEEEVNEDPEAAERLRKAREERDAEEKAEDEAFKKNCQRAETYWKWHDTKGPTGGSRISDWDGVIKAMLLSADLEDWICDIDNDLLRDVLPKDFDLEANDDWERILDAVFKAPAHHIVELLIRDRLKHFCGYSSHYNTKRMSAMLDHLEASKR